MPDAHKNETPKRREREQGEGPPAKRSTEPKPGGESKPSGWLSSLPAFQILTEAIRAVPPMRYALGVAGIIAVIAIATTLGVDLRVAALGSPILLVLMVALVIFRRVISIAPGLLKLPALIFVWSSLILVIATAVLLLTSLFFRKPMDLQQLIIPASKVVSTNQSGGTLDKEALARISRLSEAALAQAEARDYPGAWASVSNALNISARSEQARTTQTQVAMMWIRDMRGPAEPRSPAEYVDLILPCLSEAATGPKSVRAADARAHIGWGYAFKYKFGERQLAVEPQYRQALEIDGANPYANAMWGHWIISNNGPLKDATERFDKALASGRARKFVRELQIDAMVGGIKRERFECAVGLIRTWDEMRRNKETLPPEDGPGIMDYVYYGLEDEMLAHLDSILPATNHLATFLWLIDGASREDSGVVMFWRARLSEAVGDCATALPLYLKMTAVSTTLREASRQGAERCSGKGSAALDSLERELKSPDAEVRKRAASNIGNLGIAARAIFPSLLALVKDSDAEVRAAAISSMPQIGADTNKVVQALVEALKDPDRSVRNSAGESLKGLGEASVPAMVSLLNDAQPSNRQNAATTLGEIGAPASGAVAALAKSVNDKVPEVRGAAIEALGEIAAQPEVTIPVLITRLKQDQDPEVRDAAAMSLGKFGPQAGSAVHALSETLKEVLKDERDVAGFRGMLISQALGAIGPAAGEAVPVLIDGLRSQHIRVPTWAADALGNIGAPAKSAIGPLVQHLRTQDSEHLNNDATPLVQIAQALEQSGDVAALPELRKALNAMEAKGVKGEVIEGMKNAIDSLAARGKDK